MAIDLRRSHGELGETIAGQHLEHRGYRILARNFRTRFGELDLIAADERTLVFCEVKTRLSGSRRGPAGPLDAIGTRKREQLRRMARQWLAEGASADRPVTEHLRFDAIGVILTPGGRLVALEHVEAAF
jgi:putative endonuclease